MRKLNHKHVIRLYEMYESDNSIYLVLELIKGGELIKRIAKEKIFSEVDIQILLRNLIEAINHCHMKKVIHRDIKPDNLLLRDDSNIHDIIVADFGLATELHPGKEEDIIFKRCGTPGYVAPEVLFWHEG